MRRKESKAETRRSQRPLSMPEMGLFAGTRAAIGAGVALLLGEKLARKRRHRVGWTLVTVGALSTIPLVARMRRRQAA